ncbi:aspartoacylase [Anabaena azotica]|uniref:aspartoacylase n=1 Tax=Anabaena azotica TaxID=197653 RepID=UPI0039A6E414
MNPINRLAIVGGIHGNELIGVYLVKKFQKHPHLINRNSFETVTLLGNPKAILARTRYIDIDLNRCFMGDNLPATTSSTYEELRAKEIQAILKPQNQESVDVIIDLHTTTANMGLCIILGNMHPFLLGLAAYLSAINPLVKVYIHQQARNSGFLRSLCQLGFSIEVGAVAQGILDGELFKQTENLVYAVLDYFEDFNKGKTPLIQNSLNVYRASGVVDYPRNEDGDIAAMIHPQLQFRDYQPLHSGDPLFLTFESKEIFYEGESTVYPIFINEAAYYEKGIAMYLSQKEVIYL